MIRRYSDYLMYELDYTPVRYENLNDYFMRYKETHDVKYFNEFLYFYETTLERNICNFCQKYGLDDNRKEDLKQIFAALLWEELQGYDSDIPLLQIIKFKVLKAWHEYVRTNCGNVSIENSNQYATLRKVAALYYQQPKDKPLDDIVKEIATELNISENNVRRYIITSSRFKQEFNLDIHNQANECEFNSLITDKDTSTLSPETIYFINRRREELHSAHNELSDKDKMLIELIYGICPDCLGNKERKTLREASLLVGLTESGAEQKVKNILKKLKKALQE